MTTFKQFISESSTLKTLYHGGREFTRWDPSTLGRGEGMSFLALGPGLYAGEDPLHAGLYTKYAKDGIVSKLEVDIKNFFDPRLKTPEHLVEPLKKATQALDDMGLKASTRGLKQAMRSSTRSQWQKIREALVEAGIDGMWERLSETMVEWCIYNPDAIKKVSKFKE